MKKLILFVAVAVLGIASTQAQTILPKGCNSGVVDGSIQANEAQGWDFAGSNYTAVNYLVAPEAPYLAGTLTVSYVPHCEPNELCIQIIRIEEFDVTIVNNQGGCVVSKK